MTSPPKSEFLRFASLPQERVWGGRALETKLGRALPPGDRPFGESWEIVDRPEAQSVVIGGQFAGLTLRELMEKHSAAVMGPRWPAGKPCPLLVKWLDCRERLSLQVHPPAAVAAKLGGEPKTENWFVAAAAPDAHLIVGLKPGVTRAQFEAAVAAGRAEDCVNRFPVAAGDSVLVRSGTVHAIDGGNLILEIQQNSDTTYRVDDWSRVGLDGKPRQLHLAESLQSILWDAAPPRVVKAARKHSSAFARAMFGNGPSELAALIEFSIRRVSVTAGETLRTANLGGGKQARILSLIEGRLSSTSGEVQRGDNVLLPYSGQFTFTAMEDSLVLVTNNFGRNTAQRLLFRLACLLNTGKTDDRTEGFGDRSLLLLSVVALSLAPLRAIGAYSHGPQIFLMLGDYGMLGGATCCLLSMLEMIHLKRTRRRFYAAVIGGAAALLWFAFYAMGK